MYWGNVEDWVSLNAQCSGITSNSAQGSLVAGDQTQVSMSKASTLPTLLSFWSLRGEFDGEKTTKLACERAAGGQPAWLLVARIGAKDTL